MVEGSWLPPLVAEPGGSEFVFTDVTLVVFGTFAGCNRRKNWPDHVSPVRLQYEATARKKHHLLGQSILLFLRKSRGQNPISEAAHSVVKICSPVHDAWNIIVTTAWAAQVRETYKRAQRALVRGKEDHKPDLQMRRIEGSSTSRKGRGSPQHEPHYQLLKHSEMGQQVCILLSEDGNDLTIVKRHRNLGAVMAGGVGGVVVVGMVGRVGGIVKGAMTPMALTLAG